MRFFNKTFLVSVFSILAIVFSSAIAELVVHDVDLGQITLQRNGQTFSAKSGAKGQPLAAQMVDEAWVDDDFGPFTPGWDTTHFASIQTAIDSLNPGGIIHIAAGAYYEDINIRKPLQLNGPNLGVDPNTGVRGPEAIIFPATCEPDPWGATARSIVYIEVSGVTINGLSFNGDNPTLTSAFDYNGANIDASEGIASYESVSNIAITHNIIQNITYSAIDLYNYENGSPATSNNLIAQNLFEKISGYWYGTPPALNFGIGILIYNNFYADILDNYFFDVRVGIQTGNYSKANPTPGLSNNIANNHIESIRRGIFYNLHYSNATPFTVANNTITSAPGATENWGIMISSQQGGVSAVFLNNSITNTYIGINCWNDPTSNNITIQGGFITGCEYGMRIDNFDGYKSNGNSTNAILNGVTVSNSGVAALWVKDNPSNDIGATVSGGILAGTIFTNNPIDVLIDGIDASATSQINGLKWQFVNLEVTNPIQTAINRLSAGDVLLIPAGTYNENIDVNKQLTIIGAGSSSDPTVSTILTQTSAGAGDSKIGVIQLTASGTPGAFVGIKNLRVLPVNLAGISVGRFCESTGASIEYVELRNVHVIGSYHTEPCGEQERGLYVDLTSSLSHLLLDQCAFNGLDYGWYIQKAVSADPSTVSDVRVSNTEFRDNIAKGFYAEKLDNAQFIGCNVVNNGDATWGNTCTYFKPWLCGIDINLKAGAYQNLVFDNCVFSGNGIGEAKEGCGLAIKARDDGATYGVFPASLSNVTIQNCLFDGNERGIRFGEPGKNNQGPVNVVVSQTRIMNNAQSYSGTDGSAYGGLINHTQSLVNGQSNYWGGSLTNSTGPEGDGDDAFGNLAFEPYYIDYAMTTLSEGGQTCLGHFCYVPSGASANILLWNDLTVDGILLETGDEIGVFSSDPANPDGVFCVGAVIWNGANTQITVYGRVNEYGIIEKGLLAGEQMAFRVWKQATNAEFNSVNSTYNPNPPYTITTGAYQTNGLGRLTQLSVSGKRVHNVTQNLYYLDIQPAVNAATAGDLIEVFAGTYPENVLIDKSLTLCSNPADNAANTFVPGNAGSAVFTIDADNVTISGLTISNPTGKMGVYSQNHSGITIVNNTFTDIGSADGTTSGSVFAIGIVSTNAAVNNITIINNIINNIYGGDFKSANGIAIGWSTGVSDITNLRIQFNAISHITSSTKEYPAGGRGAYGIILNHARGTAGNTGRTVSPLILNNAITDLEGLWSHAIGLEGNTPDARVKGNVITNLISHKTPSDAVGVMVEDNLSAATITVDSNKFINTAIGIANVTGIGPVVAIHNWWGYEGTAPNYAGGGPLHVPFNPSDQSLNPTGQGAAATDFVSFIPWWEDEAMTIEGPQRQKNFVLRRGWNLISSYVIPNAKRMKEDIFTGKNYLIIKDDQGKIIFNPLNIDQIDDWDYKEGYMVYMNQAQPLEIQGQAVYPELSSHRINVPTGVWSYIPYFHTTEVNLPDALANLDLTTVLLVKDQDGNIYFSDGTTTINTIGNMKPGQGYQIRLKSGESDRSFNYPANTVLPKSCQPLTSNQHPSHFVVPFVNTGNNAILLVHSSSFSDGDEIGVKTAAGRLVGGGVFQQGTAVVTVWGDDVYSDELDGAQLNDDLSFCYWQASSREEQPLELVSLFDMLANHSSESELYYQQDGFWTVWLEKKNVKPGCFELGQNAPNPFNPSSVISYTLAEAGLVKLEVFNITGQKVSTLVNQVQDAGHYEVIFHQPGLESGLYFYRLSCGSFVETKKMTILK